MSKAFTREDDDAPEPPRPRRPFGPAAGEKDYLTPDGARRFRDEVQRLEAAPRTPAEEERLATLQQLLRAAEIVSPPPQPWDQVRFGATVTVRDGRGGQGTYRIVGTEETDLDRGWVSWRSPVARALLQARVGQRIRLQLPGGVEEWEVLTIGYE